MRTRTSLLCVAATLSLLAVFAAPALATRTTVRVEGGGYQVVPTTAIDVPATGGTVVDTAGHTYTADAGNPLLATGLVANLLGVPWGFTEYAGMGVFVDSFDGLTMNPTTYADWWQFTVNGYCPSVGAAGFPAAANDSYVYFQNPDAGYPPKTAKLLVVRVAPGRGPLPGETVTFSIVGDDVNKANSDADAKRFEVAEVEKPANFAPVPGAVLHIGSRVYTLGAEDASLTVDDLPQGSYSVWAAKAASDAEVYVRSARVTVDVDAAPRLSGLRVSPAAIRSGQMLKATFVLDKAATVKVTLKDGRGRVVLKTSAAYASGGRKTLSFKAALDAAQGRTLSVQAVATDSWGRSSAPVTVTATLKH